VELLVVIGIIALLISILLPALSKARATANSVKCEAQIKQVLTAMILHANEHKGYMPLVGQIEVNNGSFGNDSITLGDPRMQRYEYYTNGNLNNALGMPGSIAKYINVDLDTSSAAAVQAGLNKGIFNKLMICPSDLESGQKGYTISTQLPCAMSYAYNEAFLGWADPGGSDGITPGHGRQRANTAHMRHPSDLMLVTDSNPRGANGWMLYYDNAADCTLADIYNSSSDGFPGAPGFPAGDKSGKACGSGSVFDVTRHRGRINIGCADGHVVSIPITPGDLKAFSLNVDFGMP
jgi:prepilin-type processing-associated H-X9-DG protein